MKLPSAPKIFGRRKGAGVAERDMARSRKLVLAPLAAIAVLTLVSAALFGQALVSPEPASAHTVTKQVPRMERVCVEEPAYVRVVVGYEDRVNPRTRQPIPIYGWRWDTRTVCEWVTYYVTVNRNHWHISSEVCEYVQAFVFAATTAAGTGVGTLGGMAVGSSIAPGAGTAVGGVVGGSLGAGAGAVAGHWVNKRVCSWIPSVIWVA